MPYEYQIKKNGKLYGTLIDEYGYPLKKIWACNERYDCA